MQDTGDVKEKSKQGKVTTRGLKFAVNMIGRRWILVFFGALFGAVSTVTPVLFYFVMGDLIDVLTVTDKAEMKRQMRTLVLNMVYIAIGAGVANFLAQSFIIPAGTYVNVRLKEMFVERLFRQEIGFYDANKTGSLLANLSEDTQVVETGTVEKVSKFFENLALVIVGFIIAMTTSWKMSLVVISTSPLIVAVIVMQGRIMAYFQKKVTKAGEESTTVAEEVISSFRTVRVFAGEFKERDRFAESLHPMRKISRQMGLSQGTGMFFIMIVLWGTIALAFWYGGQLVIKEELSAGDMLKVFGMILMCCIGLAQALASFPEFAKAFTALGTLLAVLDREPKVTFEGGEKLDKIEGHIDFENVEFTYPTREGQVLHGVTASVKPGETVALVGSSGSGKSTLVALVERFYDTDNGAVKIDGHDIKTLDPIWLHQQIGIVTQEPVLFAGTILDNIKYGREDASMEEVEEAAKAANAHNFILGLDKQYNTVVGERGVSLSGGQKQRIAIARALIKNPAILLLDEATSALDTESEALVQEALDRIMVGRTTLVIAHRLTTIRNADKILVIHKGKVVESGSHDELVQIEGGAYAKLARRQMLFAEKKDE